MPAYPEGMAAPPFQAAGGYPGPPQPYLPAGQLQPMGTFQPQLQPSGMAPQFQPMLQQQGVQLASMPDPALASAPLTAGEPAPDAGASEPGNAQAQGRLEQARPPPIQTGDPGSSAPAPVRRGLFNFFRRGARARPPASAALALRLVLRPGLTSYCAGTYVWHCRGSR
jgi:hypothetical protein